MRVKFKLRTRVAKLYSYASHALHAISLRNQHGQANTPPPAFQRIALIVWNQSGTLALVPQRTIRMNTESMYRSNDFI